MASVCGTLRGLRAKVFVTPSAFMASSMQLEFSKTDQTGSSPLFRLHLQRCGLII